jgi:MFS family permease
VFYGWVILAVGAIGGVMTSPGQTYAFSAFLDHFINDLGLSRSMVSTLYTVGTLAASFVLPFVGRRFDRHGARIMITLASLLLGLACIYMSFVRNAVMLGIGFFMLRQFGQGSLSLVSKNVINLWWVRRRGRMMGIVGVFGALSGECSPTSSIHSSPRMAGAGPMSSSVSWYLW